MCHSATQFHWWNTRYFFLKYEDFSVSNDSKNSISSLNVTNLGNDFTSLKLSLEHECWVMNIVGVAPIFKQNLLPSDFVSTLEWKWMMHIRRFPEASGRLDADFELRSYASNHAMRCLLEISFFYNDAYLLFLFEFWFSQDFFLLELWRIACCYYQILFSVWLSNMACNTTPLWINIVWLLSWKYFDTFVVFLLL